MNTEKQTKKLSIKTNEMPNKNIKYEHNQISYTEKELIGIFDWNPLSNEEWDGFHIASVMPDATTIAPVATEDKIQIKKKAKKSL